MKLIFNENFSEKKKFVNTINSTWDSLFKCLMPKHRCQMLSKHYLRMSKIVYENMCNIV